MKDNWDSFIKNEEEKSYFKQLFSFLDREYGEHTCYPPREDIFTAFDLTPKERVKCVIIGQDPYHDEDQAHGLAFSVKPGVKIPPSLMNIYKELGNEFGYPIPDNGYLKKWAQQGVLMLNAVLTVRAHEAASHKGKGWELFTDEVIAEINKIDRPVVFMLWGSFAISKKKMLDNPKHLILEAAHPSPLSAYRGFFGCGHFKKCNEFLKSNGIEEIDWQIDDIQPRLF